MQKMDKYVTVDKAEKKPIELLVRLVVKDRNGVILSDTGRKPSQSFVLQFLEFWYAMFRGTDVFATATDGTEKRIYYVSVPPTQDFRVDAVVGEHEWGIVVGRNVGESPESNLDYKLDSQCTQGSGANQLMHGVMSCGTAEEVNSTVDIEYMRLFTNLSGATITVKEVGMYCWQQQGYMHCLIRDVVTAVDVPDNCSLTVYYTYRTMV